MLVSLFLSALTLVSAVVVPAPNDLHDNHDHVQRRGLPERWYQDDAHPVHKLFKRATDDGIEYPPVGSPDWSAPFPRGVPDPAFLPEAWVDALNAAVADGRIPDIPHSTSTAPGTNPIYPATVNPSSPEICSATYKCRIPGDIWDAPDGVFASSFDDGPYPSSTRLVEFLNANDVTTTHFMIGVHILANPREFLTAFEADNDIAVHTWSHPYMTTLSNLDIVGQLGWTMQLIHHSTGGRVPRYWRPPYGDSDQRVRAIAKEVFGMDTVIWNLDTDDWGISTGATSPETIHTRMEGWLAGPKSPGLMILQHEVTDASIDVFMSIFPLIAQNGWEFGSLASVVNDGRAYQNAAGSSSDDVVFKLIIMDESSASTSSSDDLPEPSESADSSSDTGGLVPTPTDENLVPSPSSSSSSASSVFRSPSSIWSLWTLSCSLAAAILLL